jgi:hypothetical protein
VENTYVKYTGFETQKGKLERVTGITEGIRKCNKAYKTAPVGVISKESGNRGGIIIVY